jgi:hypothetical protein
VIAQLRAGLRLVLTFNAAYTGQKRTADVTSITAARTSRTMPPIAPKPTIQALMTSSAAMMTRTMRQCCQCSASCCFSLLL